MENRLVIHDRTVEPGENAVIRLHIARLPSDTKIHINIHVFRSEQPGPVALVLAGVHGDEINGVEIVRRTIAQKMFENLERGTVIAIPVLNIYGFNNFSREVPYGKDVNRSFPGSLTGSLASRVAAFLTKKVLPVIDFGVDFHTGGNSNYNYPQIRYVKGDEKSKALATAFNAPILVANTPIRKSLRKTALSMGKPVLVFEGGENLRFDGLSIEKGLAGLQKLFYAQGMFSSAPPRELSRHFSKTTWMRAARPGIFRWTKNAGHAVVRGEPIGVINDPYGVEEVVVYSKYDGFIIGHNNTPVVSMGDALFHIGISE
ncbi:MAG: succinylglutamate desuccinylase [Bacteroidetes bacterium]|nr:MAG: succinylglutamate desuccinylase [Bacteroidota bacterium]